MTAKLRFFCIYYLFIHSHCLAYRPNPTLSQVTRKKRRNKYNTMNENQNMFVRDGRTTSRVLNRPGGTCSISIGGYTEEELEKQRQIREARANGGSTTAAAAVATTSNNVSKNQQDIYENSKKVATNDNISQQDGEKVEEEKEKSSTKTTTVEKKPISTSSNAFASSSTTNSFNVLTDRPTSKVTRPPGGQTNWSLG